MPDNFDDTLRTLNANYVQGDENYNTGVNKSSSVGTEKNYDSLDEKVSEENIREIPRYDVIARHKARKQYRELISGYRYLKSRIESSLRKVERINKKLEKHATYPDEAFGRDELLREKYKLENDINNWNNTLTTVSKEKIRIYGKALGLPRKPDSFFEVIPTTTNNNSKNLSSVVNYMKEFNKKENEKEENVVKEEDIKLDPLSDAKEIYEEERLEKESVSEKIEREISEAEEKQEEISLGIDDQLYALYNKFSKIYGEENVKKHFADAIYSVINEEMNKEKNNTEKSVIVDYGTTIKSDAEEIYDGFNKEEINRMLNDEDSSNNNTSIKR